MSRSAPGFVTGIESAETVDGASVRLLRRAPGTAGGRPARRHRVVLARAPGGGFGTTETTRITPTISVLLELAIPSGLEGRVFASRSARDNAAVEIVPGTANVLS